MARYALRNQQKIKEVYGTSVLERMKVSLDDDVPEQQNTCDICALDTKGLTEFCPCARCSDFHFKEIKDHE